MKRTLTLSLLVLLLAITIQPAQAADSPYAGVWTAREHDQPFVALELNDCNGKLSGQIIFYLLIKQPDGSYTATASDPLQVIHPRTDGNTLVFEVVHPKHHGSIDPADQELKTFRVEFTGNNQAAIKNAIDGKDLTFTRIWDRNLQ